jgi:glutamine synthetase
MSTIEGIRERLEREGTKRVKLGGFDVDGILRGKYVSLEKFHSILEGGLGFCDVIFGWDSQDALYDRPSLTGPNTGYPDVGATVDLGTLRLIPWEPGTAAFLLDFQDADRRPLEVSPRQLLKKVLERLRQRGFIAKMATEYEFFVYQETPWSLKEKGYRGARPLSPGMFGYSWLRTSQAQEWGHALMDAAEAFEVPVEGFHTETGPGVFEAALLYSEALEAADRAALFKVLAKSVLSERGLLGCFMAKPANGLPGCSGHTHQSLWDLEGQQNLFFDPAAPRGVSALCRSFIAGQLALMPELCALYAPNVNSYKRLLDGNWAPSAATWGFENRTCALRMIPGSSKSTRVEFRLTAADLNPYIAQAAMLAAGLYGIEQGLEAPTPVTGSGYESGAERLPRSLAEACERLSRSELARELLGSAFVEHYLVTREWEAGQAARAVTDWELARYMELA